MRSHQNENEFGEKVYVAGQQVPAGIYRQVGRSREIRLERDDVLPASLDGQAVSYVRVWRIWAPEQLDRYGETPRPDPG